MTRFIERHPVAFSCLIWLLQILGGVGYAALLLCLRGIAVNDGPFRAVWDSLQDWYGVLYSLVYTLVAVAIVGALKWWREVGFVPIGEWRHLHLYIVPLLITCLIALPGMHLTSISQALSVQNLAFYLLVGFREEVFNRGIIQTALSRRGNALAVALSAFLFGLIHVSRLFIGTESVLLTVLQVFRTMAWGFGMSVLRIRTRTIAPLMVLHALTLVSVDIAWAGFAGTPPLIQWLIFNELPFYLIGLCGAFLLPRVLDTHSPESNRLG